MTNRQHNNQQPLEFPKDRSAFLQQAFESDDGCVSVGGLAYRTGLARGQDRVHEQEASGDFDAVRVALAKFVELWRRQNQITVEEFARRASLSEAEIISIESGEVVPEPRVLFQLSQTIHVSYDKLMQVAGHVVERDHALSNAAVRFAARSEPMEKLTRHEQEALHEFINLLGQ